MKQWRHIFFYSSIKSYIFSLLQQHQSLLFYFFQQIEPKSKWKNTHKKRRMELELGLKITKFVDDCTSTSLNISKDRGGTLFLSRETDTMFILTAHLKGYLSLSLSQIYKLGSTYTSINSVMLSWIFLCRRFGFCRLCKMLLFLSI